MAGNAELTVWPILHYDDTGEALRFLVDVLGFQQALVVRDDDGNVVHAELRWPTGGAVVFGSTKHTDSVHGQMRPGASAIYVASPEPEVVDAVDRRVKSEAGDIVEGPYETRFGSGATSYTLTVRDPEGNLWTFGTYRGAS